MKVAQLKSGLMGLASASVSSVCCLLPLAVVLLGLGTGAFAATTRPYSFLFISLGLVGLALSYWWNFKQGLGCTGAYCQLIRRVNLGLLIFATLVIAAALVFNLLPGTMAALLTGRL